MASITEFKGWLQKGLGRSVVHLRTHDPQPYREAVLHACTHNLTYDSQCEGSREKYLLDLIHSAADEQFFRNGLLSAFTTEQEDPEEFDLGQTIEIARTFAETGDIEIKRAMYDAVVRAGFEQAGCCYSDLIKLDGLDALLFAAEHFPASIPDDELWQVSVLITALEDREGAESANEAIQRASQQHPSLARMLEAYRAYDCAFQPRESDRSRPDYPTLKGLIADGQRQRMWYFANWGKTASEQELEAAAYDLMKEKDEARLLACLWVFQFRQFPGPIGRVLGLAQSSDIRIARGAVAILAKSTHPDIRALALTFLGIPARRGDAADLLVSNYQPGDFQMIEARLREPIDIDDFHHFGFGVRDLLEAHCQVEAEGSLLLLYEKGPCTLCRHRFVENLISIQRLPDWIREECRYDASDQIRKLVQ